MRITNGTILAASALDVASSLLATAGWSEGASVLGVLSWIAAVACAVAALACVVTWRGATVYESMLQRRRMRRAPRSGVLVSAEHGSGMVFGDHTSVFIETLPRPWEVNLVAGNGDTDAPMLPLSGIAATLRQYDILCTHVRAVSAGFKRFSPADRAADAVVSGVGAVALPLGGRTFLEVAVSADTNGNAVAARTRAHETAADGLAHATMVAAERVRRVCVSAGIPARILSPAQVQALHAQMKADLGALLETPQWTHTGEIGSGAVQTATAFTPSSFGDAEVAQWGELAATRTYAAVTVSPRTMDVRAEGEGDTFDYAMVYKVTDPSVLGVLSSVGLTREDGRHGDRVTHLLPLTIDNDIVEVPVGQPLTRTRGVLVPRGQEPPMSIPAHPLGVWIGTTARRDRAFMSLARGGSPLWVIGAPEFALRMMVRASITGARIASEVPGAAWEYVIGMARSPRLTDTSDQGIEAVLASHDVVFTTAERVKGVNFTGQCPAVIVVTSEEPPLLPRNWVRPIAGRDQEPDRPDIVTVHLAGHTANTGEDFDLKIARPATEGQWVAG